MADPSGPTLQEVIPAGHVPVVGPSGEFASIPSAQYEEHLKRGYRFQTPEEQKKFYVDKKYGEGWGPAKAALAGAARGVTLGLSDVVAPALGINPATLSGLKQANPVASVVGEVPGMLINPVGEVGAGVRGAVGATSVLGRLGAHVLAGAAEGTLFGAGNAVSESALGDEHLTAEKLIASGGLGAILGGAGGGIGGVVSEGLGYGARKLANLLDDGEGSLKTIAARLANKGAGATQRDIRYLGQERAQAVGQTLLDRGHLGTGAEAPTSAGIYDSITKDLGEQGKVLDGIYSDAAKAGIQPKWSQVSKAVDEFESGLHPEQEEAVAGDIARARRSIDKYGMRPANDSEGFSALREFKQDLQAQAQWGDPALEFAGGLKRRLAGVIRDEMDQQLLPQLGSDVAKKLTDTNELIGNLIEGQKIAEHGVERLANASFGLRDTGIAIGAISHGNPLLAIAGAMASKAARERGPALVARLVNHIADSDVMQTVADHFSAALEKTGTSAFGDFGPVLANAMAQGPEQALATHMALSAQYPDQYAPLAARAGFPLESPQASQAALTKAHGLMQVKAALDAHDQGIGRLADKAIRGGKDSSSDASKTQDFGSRRMSRDAAASHEARLNEVRQLAAQPQSIADRVAGNVGQLSQVAPATTAAAAGVASAAVAFLQSKAPQEPPPTLLGSKWQPSRAESDDFAEYLQATQEPLSLLHAAAAGTLGPKSVEAVKTVYPGLYKQIQDAVVERLADRSSEVPHRQLVMLSLLTGMDLDGTMGQQMLQRNQAASAPAPQQPQGGGAKPRTAGLEKLDFASRTQVRNSAADEA